MTEHSDHKPKKYYSDHKPKNYNSWDEGRTDDQEVETSTGTGTSCSISHTKVKPRASKSSSWKWLQKNLSDAAHKMRLANLEISDEISKSNQSPFLLITREFPPPHPGFGQAAGVGGWAPSLSCFHTTPRPRAAHINPAGAKIAKWHGWLLTIFSNQPPMVSWKVL